MSGPKDYEFVFTAVRLVEIQLRRAREHESRQTRVLARLSAQREQAVIAAKKATARRLAVARELAAKKVALRNSENSQTATKPLATPAAASSPQVDHVPISPAQSPEQPSDFQKQLSQDRLFSTGEADEEKASESVLADVVQWQNELAQDEDVLEYQAQEAQTWTMLAKQFLAEFESGHTLAAEEAGRNLIQEARRIHEQAGGIRGQFATRNELIQDVVSSLEEIGFFVADPYFENDDKPAGAVIVRATRGSETMTASIDLSDTIKSIWDGIPGETCKGAFFDYVDNMARKGVKIEPLRDDLRNRPTLLRKGAKDLPTDGRTQERQA